MALRDSYISYSFRQDGRLQLHDHTAFTERFTVVDGRLDFYLGHEPTCF
jgi:hypothetical protein